MAACKAKPADKYDLSHVVCIDARDPENVRQQRSDTETGDSTNHGPQITIRPNLSIIVRVIFGPRKVLSVSLGGNGGQTIAEIIGGTPTVLVASASGATAGKLCGDLMFCAKFAPRTPGVARLQIMFQPPPADTPPPAAGLPAPVAEPKTSESHFEYLIPRIYSGAIRVGLSAVVGAGDAAYTSNPRGGAAGGVVSELPSSAFTYEVVVGYAPFLEAFSQREGRDYVHPVKWYARRRFAPYFGLGVVSAATSPDGGTRPAWLRSVYLGVEYEPFHGASIAAGLVVRRADRLAGGLRVGDAVPDGSVLTDTRTELGAGVVFNFTPDFFKVAASVGAK